MRRYDKITTTIEILRTLLQANDIHEYDDAQDSVLEAFISEAKMLINEPFCNDTTYNDYVEGFTGKKYVTDYYPLKADCLEVTFNDIDISEHIKKITEEGIIYFDKQFNHGTLDVTYVVGLSSEDIENYIIPITLYLIRDKTGRNVSSITEGDVSISYNNSTGGTAMQIDTLINNLKDKYCARLCLL